MKTKVLFTALFSIATALSAACGAGGNDTPPKPASSPSPAASPVVSPTPADPAHSPSPTPKGAGTPKQALSPAPVPMKK